MTNELPVEQLPDGSVVYVTVDDDVVDHIAFRRYGRHTGTMEAVLDANPGLASMPIKLPAGVRIILPSIPDPEPAKQIELWD